MSSLSTGYCGLGCLVIDRGHLVFGSRFVLPMLVHVLILLIFSTHWHIVLAMDLQAFVLIVSNLHLFVLVQRLCHVEE